ncbi:MAG TPA: shikimate kinase [Syntrophales bacterium]|nr:shikimate kinase [Syntrophales bacterium]HOM07584.1 shikimate kinase [Syntrophales bacterium]HOO00211.1 shikimate kinase [Syntrophales bacterium]HPC01574.1 shikimate kinase [Syntrophales bacterium]HPQ07176.1 shikimate kinase [Syntrophales bacterium]
MNLVLIGFRGAGKTTVGALLARWLKRPFYDTDAMVQERSGASIAAVVARGGWGAFRRLEREAVRDLAEKTDDAVIALGGGAVVDPENVRLLRGRGVFVYLAAAPEELIKRIAADGKTAPQRPSLKGGDLVADTLAALEERVPLYRSVADLVVETTGLTPPEAAQEIMGELRLWPATR